MSSSTTDLAREDRGTAAPSSPGDVLMPQMGTSVAEGTIVVWKVSVGDVVLRDQVLCEVSTDKVDVECPAPRGGTIAELLVDEGETVDVGTVIARLRDAGGVASSGGAPTGGAGPGAAAGHTVGADAAAPSADAAPGRPAPDPRAARREVLRRSSPVAARLAAEHGLDVLALTGSGRGGRVTKRDVLAAATSTPPTAATATAPSGAEADPSGAGTAPSGALMHTESPYRHDPSIPVAGSDDRVGAAPSSPVDRATSTADTGPADPGDARRPTVPSDLGGTPVPPSRMRRAIGDAVRRSLDTAAHCTTVVECDMGRIERERRELGSTALPLVAHHAIRALQAFPALNATWDGDTVVRYGDRVHLGIAVSLGEDGLIAPVIHDAQDLSVQGLARRIKELAARARAGELHPDEVRGGTFTITNPGAAGAVIATPVINGPQVAILDLEAIVRRPVVVTDADGGESIGIRPMVHLCMGWDHRALDGLYAAQFLTALRGRLEG